MMPGAFLHGKVSRLTVLIRESKAGVPEKNIYGCCGYARFCALFFAISEILAALSETVLSASTDISLSASFA